jgi:hypothetical protein
MAIKKSRERLLGKATEIDKEMSKHLEDFLEFDEFRNTIPKEVRRQILAGRSADEIMKHHAPLAAGRIVAIAATSEDPKMALAASKDIIDRSQGRATERKEITHRYEDLSDEELNSILMSEVEDIKEIEGKPADDKLN